MKKPTFEQLEAAIRAGADQAHLLRMLGPTPQELEEAKTRCMQLEVLGPKCEFEKSYPSTKEAENARAKWERVMRSQDAYENRYL